MFAIPVANYVQENALTSRHAERWAIRIRLNMSPAYDQRALSGR